jgi:predicted RNase H-like nuclease
MKQWDGFDECVIGVANIWRDQITVEVLVYSADAMIEILRLNDGMSEEEALEYFEFNIEGAYIGIDTPVLVFTDPDWKERDYELDD